MKEFDLIYSQESDEIFLFTGLDLQKLLDPLTIEREQKLPEAELTYDKKKSELIEYEDEDYLELKEKEEDPFIITDYDSKTFSGRYQNIDTTSSYLAFINTGTTLKMVPVGKWYSFVQRNQFTEVVESNPDKLNKILAYIEEDTNESGSDIEIDYQENFDDDDEEEAKIYKTRRNVLSDSGKEIQGIVESYNDEMKETEPRPENLEESNKKAKIERILTKEDLKKIFGNKKMAIKDLLLNIKSNFKLGTEEKELIKEFLNKSCVAETDKQGEKCYKLKR